MSKVAAQLTNFRDLPEDELRAQLATTRDELFRLQLGQYTNQVTSTAAITGKRRDIARLLTILRARELGKETQAQKAATDAGTSTDEAAPKKTKAKTPRKAKAKS
jgi:large subunit ribosomal protein L29